MARHPLLAFPSTERLASPFEEWCEQRGVHPEHWAAWPAFEAEQQAHHDVTV